MEEFFAEIEKWVKIIVEAIKAMFAGIKDPDSVLLPADDIENEA